ncbi:2,3-diphosphoglycerate-dependent phosphoglycerate mutase [Candidatus Nitrosacidococcus sp. I8]|uniref:2,3-diphosphoglycerate-dependent phosphoglycerate mutase n=1 Tax=Candidatus Nitrosacidococcus sp. I8 TaxID=2942908 RepID=UPI002226A3B7|nr:2,3-diphosphoglycerate-dependent phosphoglycerate mutase [Candidatus Nitrosacidococcus sp. I8]CAH9018059.1 2,3-bisphosphoglycerate-dependent phosphoglycerate mutase [Candidatus Nitrosacidococcus sp. I8]
MHRVTLLRHGESIWNLENRFTGWTDVELSENGIKEASHAGKILKDAGYEFDKAYTSLLKRAIHTLRLVEDQMDISWLSTEKRWELNERHYGSLQGLNKAEIAKQYGADLVHQWRRGYDIEPPALDINDPRHPRFDRRYAHIDPSKLPLVESLKTTLDRVMQCWQESILPDIASGKELIIVAHGNSLRALCKHLAGLSNEEVMELEIPTGVPLVYELDNSFKLIDHYYLSEKGRSPAHRA